MRWIRALLVLVACVTVGAPLLAEDATLEDVVQATKASFAPSSPDDALRAKAALAARVEVLSRYLQSLGANGENWKRYLKWKEMQAALDAGAEARVGDLREIALQYFADFPGLELPQFRQVGNALRNYANVLYASREDKLAEKYAATVDGVAKLLGEYAAAPAEAKAATINNELRWLARYGKPDKLLQRVREEYSRPNLYLNADEALIAHGLSRDLNENTPLNDSILGTRIRGNGHTVGRLDARLQPSGDRATLDLILSGTTTSHSVGSNRSALIYSAGVTTISGFKRISIDEHEIRATPASAQARTNSRITGIGSTRGGIAGCIVKKVASKKAAQSKGQVTAIATRHAEARIRERLDQEAAKQLEASNRDLRVKFREPLQRSGTYPALVRFSSTADELNVKALEANWTQLGAPNDPPVLDGDHAMTVLAHESLVNNAANTMFSGRTLHDYEIRNEIIRRKGSLPEEMKDDEDRDPWSISFEDDQPVHFQIDGGGFSVLIRFSRFTSGERKLRHVNLAADYKAKKEGTRLVFERQGEIVVKRDGEQDNQRIPIGEVALRSILRKKFSKLFKDRIEGEGMELPGKYKSLGKLPVGNYQLENGWAAVGWELPGRNVAATQKISVAK
jgi:hypothetical protein